MSARGGFVWPGLGAGGWVLLLTVAVHAGGCATAPRGAAGPYLQQAPLAGYEASEEAGLWAEPPAEAPVSPLFNHKRQREDLGRLELVVRRAELEELEEAGRLGDCPRPPETWPERSEGDEELLAPFFACGSPSGFLALQRAVDMAEVLERLGDWSAVRLGGLGPLRDSRAAEVLTRKRAGFLLEATADYGAFAQVFALFILHTAYDDEVGELLKQLAGEKQLSQTLGTMPGVRQELERRGLPLTGFAEREEQAGDVLRGLKRAGRDVLNSTLVSDGARMGDMRAQAQQLPAPYQQAVYQLGQRLVLEHFAPGNVALGSFDTLTFGVPLGFYHLGQGTAHGLQSLQEGQYEQATRELAPAALLVGLYATGKGARLLASVEGGAMRPWLPELRLERLRQVAWQLSERLGLEGLAEVARYVRASREAAVFVTAGGEPAAVALYEARGNVARAQATLAKALPESTGAAEPRPPSGATLGGLASLVDEGVGHSREVVEAKLLLAELETQGPRLPADTALLQKLQATLEAPPPGVPEGYALWNDYLAYRRARLALLEEGKSAQGPLRWEPYERLRGEFARGLAFERLMLSVLREDAALPPSQRRWLSAFTQPRIEVHVGLSKSGVPGVVRFADVLVIEERPPPRQAPRVETFSFKSRNLKLLDEDAVKAIMLMDARAALEYYGGTVNILRHSLKGTVQVQRVRLVYEGGSQMPVRDVLKPALREVERAVKGVEVVIQ